jgi:flagellar basal body-associated protein FliL
MMSEEESSLVHPGNQNNGRRTKLYWIIGVVLVVVAVAVVAAGMICYSF